MPLPLLLSAVLVRTREEMVGDTPLTTRRVASTHCRTLAACKTPMGQSKRMAAGRDSRSAAFRSTVTLQYMQSTGGHASQVIGMRYNRRISDDDATQDAQLTGRAQRLPIRHGQNLFAAWLSAYARCSHIHVVDGQQPRELCAVLASNSTLHCNNQRLFPTKLISNKLRTTKPLLLRLRARWAHLAKTPTCCAWHRC